VIRKDKNISLFLIFLLVIAVAAPLSAAPLADYHFDECYWDGTAGEVIDATGNGYDGTAVNGVTTVAEGLVCRAGEFSSGSSQYVDLGNGFSPGSSNWSISVWFKWDGSSGENIIYNKENLFEARVQSGYFQYAWQPHWYWDGTSFPVTAGQWTHAVVTYDGSSQRVYRNGILVYERAQSGDIGSNSNKLLIGARGSSSPQHFFGGQIDEVLIYSEVLTGVQISDIYTNQQVGNNQDGSDRSCAICEFTAIASYYLDECAWYGSAGEVMDASGNGYHGAAVNGVTTIADGQICRAGEFADDGYLALSGFPDITTDFTMTAWIKTTDRSQSGQRVFADDESNSHGYALSLGDGGAGTLRFYSRGISPVILDTPAVIANDTWYFVVGVADIAHQQRHIYVFSADGTLLNHTSDTSSGYGGVWGTDPGTASIGGETNTSSETGNRFIGTLDEVQILTGALDDAGLKVILHQTHGCSCINPLADYHFDECYWDGSVGEVIDAGVNGYDGTAKNGVTTVASGQVCRAGEFASDSSQYVDLGNGFSPGNSSWTVSVWFKWDGSSGENIIYNKENLFEARVQGGYFQYAWQPHWSWDGGTSFPVNAGQWTHAVITYDGSTQLVYENGSLVYERSQSGSLGSNSNKLLIGARGSSAPQHFFGGQIDEVLIYSEALTGGQISDLYTNQLAGKNEDGSDRTCPVCGVIPIASYHMDECSWDGSPGEVIDSSGHHHDGDGIGQANTEESTMAGGGLCRVGLFGGTGDYVNIVDSPELNPNSAFSVSVWFKADSLSTWNGVISKLTDVNHHAGLGWNIQVGTAQRIASLMADASGNYVYLRSTTIPQAGVWYHVVLVHQSDNVNNLYVDGHLEASNSHGIAFAGNDLQIGKFYTNSNGLYFAGAIDEVALFTGALSDDEVWDIYDNQRGGENWDGSLRTCHQCTFDALASYYMDECSWDGSVGEVLDSSGHGYDGQAFNGVITVDNGKVCRAGEFADNGYLALPLFPDLTTDFTMTAWIKTTDRTQPGQRVFVDDESNSHGYALSLGDGGAGTLRFYNRGISPVILDTPAVINNDTWYFVAAVTDIANQQRHSYVFSADGTLLNHTSDTSSGYGGVWGTDPGTASIGGETNQGETANRFIGNLDEVQVFNGAIDAEGLGIIFKQTHGCSCIQVQADYRFDECQWNGLVGEVEDSSGNGHSGTVKNGAMTENSLDAGGGICQVAHLDGQNDYVEIPSSTDFNPSMGFSVSTWFRADGLSSWNGVVSKLTNVNSSNGRGWNIQVGTAQGIASLMADDAGNYVYLRSGVSPQVGVWYHVVLVHGPDGANDLYVNGSLKASNHHGIGFTDNPLQVGKFYTDSDGLFFDGRIDEVKIFAGSITASQVLNIYQQETGGYNWDGSQRICPSCSRVDHFIITDEDNDQQALACQAELITIQAVDSSGSLMTSYTSNVTLTADNGALWYDILAGYTNDDPSQGSWTDNGHSSASYSFTAADNGQIKLWLRDSDIPAGQDSEVVQVSVVDGTAVGSLAEIYHKAGFQLVWGNPDNTIQLSGKPSDQGWNAQNIELQAVQVNSATGACESLLDGSITVQAKISYLDPAAGGSLPLKLNGTNVDEDWTSVTLVFDQGEAPLVFRYDDAGKLRLEIRYDSDGNGIFDIFCINNPAIIFRPLGLSVYSTTSNWEANNGADSSAFVKAGTAFNISARAVVWQQSDDADNDGTPDSNANLADNNVTSNYQASGNSVTHILTAPSGGSSGSLGSTSMDFASGSGMIAAQTFSEVGIIKITISDDDYLGSGSVITGASGNIGRFIPDHFSVQLTAVSLAPACSTFTYLGQNFGYQDAPQITITAQHSANEETQNYRDDFFKLPVTLTPSYGNNVSGRTLMVTPGSISLAVVSSQTVTVTDTFSYFRELVSPFDADFDLTLTISDSDGVLYGSDGNFVINNIGGTQLRSGRLMINDNYGLEIEDIIHSPFNTQYWDGSQWQLNSDDNCTTGITFDFSRAHITSSPEISSGVGYLMVDKPASATPETISVCPVSPAWLSCSGTDCCGSFLFGIYRGNDRLIMKMEVPE
jgi:hypothetical protein